MIKFIKLEEVSNRIDQLILEKNHQHLFLSKKFLSYHNKRFNTYYLKYFDKKNEILTIPVVVKDNLLFSHPGASYGGILQLSNNIDFNISYFNFLKDLKQNNYILNIKLPDHQLLDRRFNKFNTLIQKNIKPTFIEEETIIKLEKHNYSSTATSNFNKGHKTEINRFQNKIDFNFKKLEEKYFEEYYKILYKNTQKFNKSPTHNFEEFKYLHDLFPNNIKTFCVTRKNDNHIIAGVTVFVLNSITISAFYSTYNYELGKDYLGSLKYVYWKLFSIFQNENYKYFNFGIDVPYGAKPSDSLRYFKNGFGGEQIYRSHYDLNLK